MYDALSTAELAVLQKMLYAATEKAYRLANLTSDSADLTDRYFPVHTEIAHLFLEAGHELRSRTPAAVPIPARGRCRAMGRARYACVFGRPQ
jgi:hypothetical protein